MTSSECPDLDWNDTWEEQLHKCYVKHKCLFNRNTFPYRNTCVPWTCENISLYEWDDEYDKDKEFERTNRCENNPAKLNCKLIKPRSAPQFGELPWKDHVDMQCVRINNLC